MSKLMLRRQCPSHIRHQLVLSLHQATSQRIPENFPFKSANSPSAERWRTADRKRPLPIPLRRFFPSRMLFITKLGPQVSLSPVPVFGDNKWETQHKSLRNHVESYIHTMKVHTRSSLPPGHTSLSLDLTWSSQASPRKTIGKRKRK
jgi:hypothetical protein